MFKYMSSDNCELVLTWHTAAACPLKSVTGTNCMVSDEDSGLTFDLKRLAKSGNDFYNVREYFLGGFDTFFMRILKVNPITSSTIEDL